MDVYRFSCALSITSGKMGTFSKCLFKYVVLSLSVFRFYSFSDFSPLNIQCSRLKSQHDHPFFLMWCIVNSI